MSMQPDPERETLASRVAWSPSGVAYVPNRLLVRDDDAADHVDAITGRRNDRRPVGKRDDVPGAVWHLLEDVPEPLETVALARSDGYEVQPDHVLFAHGCDECCGALHPSWTYDAVLADPLRGNPLRGNPLRGNPLRGNPLRGNYFSIDPLRGNESQTSSARPVLGREFAVRTLNGPGAHPRITVLDTGLAAGAQLPALLDNANRITGTTDDPDQAIAYSTGVKAPADTWLDPVAGHGTFIAGVLEQLAPGCDVRVEQVLQPLGDAVESDIIAAILDEASLPPGQRPQFLSLSFGGTTLAQAPALASAIAKAQLAGIVVVASAGNAGSSEPQYPAAYDGVIAVGALGPDGPTPWTNYGSWVDACAPGLDLVSSFFADFDGPAPEINTVDPDRFSGWARWSGTSFATPVVVAALAREMVAGGLKTPQEAVARVIQAPHALRIRCLGTVVSA